MILNNFKILRLQIAWNGWLTQKKHMLLFSLNIKMIRAYFFIVFKAFLKEYLVILILISEVWTEEMKLFALHISNSSK